MILYPYFGGKNQWLSSILPLLDVPSGHFASGCFGSGAIELNRPPAKLETINDKDDLIINFLDMLRTRRDDLIQALSLTAWGRREYERASGRIELIADPLERARLFYVRVRLGFNSSPRPCAGWRFSVSAKSGNNPPRSWKNALDGLYEVADRLTDFQIDSISVEEFAKTYDGHDTLFYFDPPYVKGSRERKTDRYNHEMTDDQHRALADALRNLKGKAALSGYQNEIYAEILHDWHMVEFGGKSISSSSRKGEPRSSRNECLWLNYTPPAQQLTLFTEASA